MNILCIFSILLLSVNYTFGQNFEKSRITRARNATVYIHAVDGSSGTGFYVTADAKIATCWHVVERPFLMHKQIFIYSNFNMRDSMEVVVIGAEDSVTLLNYNAYDYCLLQPVIRRTVAYLPLSGFTADIEGVEVYSCGYPYGKPVPFISRGFISTVFNEQVAGYGPNSRLVSPYKLVGLMDMTLNRGNSGGAIIKRGETPEQDSVVGIADFIYSPLGMVADSLENLTSKGAGRFIQGFPGGTADEMKIFSLLSHGVGKTSVGVSGCIAIDYLANMLESNQRRPNLTRLPPNK